MNSIYKQNDQCIQEYIGYIDRSRRTTEQTRLEIHSLRITKDAGIEYGLSISDLENITKIFEQEEKESCQQN